MGNLSWIDIAVLAMYFVAMLIMGLYFLRKNKSTEEYFVGGRSYGGWIIGISLVGTYISSITFVSFPADAFKTSWIRFLPNFALPIGTLVAAYIFLPLFRRIKGVSAYEYLENRFGPSVRFYASFAFILTQIVRLSIMLYLVAILFQEITGADPKMCIIIAGIIVAFYTIIGGIDAVIWTDVVQTVILALGSIVCLMVIVHMLPGGMGQLFSVAWEHNKLSFCDYQNGNLVPISWGFSLGQKTGTMMILFGLTYWLSAYSTSQITIQRYYTTKDIHQARKAMWIAAGICIPIWAFYMFLGTALYVFFTQFPAVEASEVLSGTRKAEQILPFFVIKYLPKGLVGLVVASALAAAMSSLSASINSVSTSFVSDIYRRFLVKAKPDKHYLHTALWIAVVSSAIMIAGAVILVDIETTTLQDATNILASLLGGGLLAIYMLGFFTKVADGRAVVFGLVCTIIFTAWTVFAERKMLPDWLNVPFDLYYTMMIGNVVMLITTVGAAFVFPRKKPLETGLTVWN
ncbi:MAG: sodium/solute symporter [Phycisphaerales bacterium]